MQSKVSNSDAIQTAGDRPVSVDSATRLSSLKERRHFLRQGLEQCRAATLETFAEVDDATFRRQAHPDFSPAGWHLGHIGYTEGRWILEQCAGRPPIFPEYRRLFAADGLPKHQRSQLPAFPEICELLQTIRTQVLEYLEIAPLDEQERLWRWLIQHESQHSETITLVLELQRRGQQQPLLSQGQTLKQKLNLRSQPLQPQAFQPEMVKIPAGWFQQGHDSLDALDNERPVHSVYLDTYWIDRYPVTCREYRAFMAAGGYHDPQWWSEAGWQWLQANPVEQPLYGSDDPAWEDHPVCGVSGYEAEAYAKFVGKRLPTEAEWEKAATWDAIAQQSHLYPWGATPPRPGSAYGNYNHQVGQTTPVYAFPSGRSPAGCEDMLGNVWEWTSSWFEGYAGFVSYPYPGYSQVYFDQQHRVLRGGSWATRPWSLRSTFRNWYHPGVRQILAGFRCATDRP